MEYIEHGDLRANLKGPLKETEARTIAWQLSEGLRYMHDKGFVHRDLKPGVRMAHHLHSSREY